jgi:hypothetical protein
MKRDGARPRKYEVIQTIRTSTFIMELNDTAARGFRIVPNSVKGSFAVVQEQSDSAKFSYSVAEGAEDSAKALSDVIGRGGRLVAVLGGEPLALNPKPMLLFEQPQNGTSAPAGRREYRIPATSKTSTLDKEVKAAAAEGFRVMNAGFMNVVMERNLESSAAPVEYWLLAMIRVETAQRELNGAGAWGFRIAVVPESTREGVFIMHHPAGASERFEYLIVRLKERTANDVLMHAEADRYRPAVLFNDLLVLERPANP